MIQKIRNWLLKPYYFNDDNRFKLLISFGLGFFTFLFLVILTPAGASDKDIEINPYVFRLVYGIISTSVLLFYFFVFTKRFPKYYNNENWTIGKHLFNIFCIMLVCGIINAFYSRIVLTTGFFNKNTGFIGIIVQSIIYGIFPTLVYIYFDEKQRFKKANDITIKDISNVKKSRIIKNTTKKVTIFATNNKDNLSFKLNNLIYVTSDTNYACFYIKENNKLREHILRLPLKTVEASLKKFENITRCHKSYIINSDYVKNISGNARGYYLHLKEVDELIPVSRKFSVRDLENLTS